MPKYFDGYSTAFNTVAGMDEQDLLDQIDTLYGRKRLPENYTLDQLRDEALRQTRLDWLDSADENYWMYKRILEGE